MLHEVNYHDSQLSFQVMLLIRRDAEILVNDTLQTYNQIQKEGVLFKHKKRKISFP